MFLIRSLLLLLPVALGELLTTVTSTTQDLASLVAAAKNEEWPLKWFPRNPEEDSAPIPTDPPRRMGQLNSQCDDGKTNLTLDDNGQSHLCLSGQSLPIRALEPQFKVYEIPERFVAIHRCMNEAIEYEYRVPTL